MARLSGCIEWRSFINVFVLQATLPVDWAHSESKRLWTLPLSDQHSCFMVGRSWVWVRAQILAVLPQFFIGFPQSLQADARIMPQIGHGRFFPHLSALLCHRGPTIRLFVARSIDSIVKRIIKNKWNECKKEISVIYTQMLHCDLFLVTQFDGQIQEWNKII
jgi:hypothetical protein